MDIATTSCASHLFPTNQRFEIEPFGCKFTDFSDVSLLDPQILSRINRRDCENSDLVAPKKRQHSDEANPPKKRQKTRIEFTKAKSITTLKASLDKSVSESKQETKTKVTKPVDGRSKVTTKPVDGRSKVTTKPVDARSKITTKPEKSITVYETETKKPDLRNLIAKAQQKIQEKRLIDDRQVDITNQRIAARLALNQVVATGEFYEHLNYHKELEQLGCTFIKEQVDFLKMFNLLSRSDFSDESNYSVLEKEKSPRSNEDSTRKKNNRSRKDKSMKHSSEDPHISNSGESAESYNQRKSSVRSSTSGRIQ